MSLDNCWVKVKRVQGKDGCFFLVGGYVLPEERTSKMGQIGPLLTPIPLSKIGKIMRVQLWCKSHVSSGQIAVLWRL